MKYNKIIDVRTFRVEFNLYNFLVFLSQTKLDRKILSQLSFKISNNFYNINSIDDLFRFLSDDKDLQKNEYLLYLLNLIKSNSIEQLSSELYINEDFDKNINFDFQFQLQYNLYNFTTNNNIHNINPFKLSPSSIKQINNNPYFYYVKNLLNLRPLVFNDKNDLARQNGILLHLILEKFTQYCQSINNVDDITEDVFISFLTQNFSNLFNSNTSLYEKLFSFASKIIQMEKNAKLNNLEILVEKQTNYILHKYNILAVADRIEIDHNNKFISIYDYKTGTLPTVANEMNGKAVQLSIIAYILLNTNYKDYSIDKLVYMNFNKINDNDLVIFGDKLHILLKNSIYNIELIFDNYFNNCKEENFMFIPSSLNMLYEDVLQLEHFARKRRYFNVI